MLRAGLEAGRGEFDAAHRHYRAARTTLRPGHGDGIFEIYLAELALWQGRWTDALRHARDALALARVPFAAHHLRVWFCAKALRAQAEVAALARAGRDPAALRQAVEAADALIDDTRQAARLASRITPNADGWLALAEAEYQRALGRSDHRLWSQATDAWDRLDRAPEAAYCRWRRAEALAVNDDSAIGSGKPDPAKPLREAHAIAVRLQARPLLRQLELLAQRARIDLTPPSDGGPPAEPPYPALGLTRREAEVLSLIADGLTNREIAEALSISASTASVHVSNILRKLDAPNRREAAAIAHRVQQTSEPTRSRMSAGTGAAPVTRTSLRYGAR
jgi:DNA-binding CsgD family transcriptional regulator